MKLKDKISYMAMPGLKTGVKFFGILGGEVAKIIELVEDEFGISYKKMQSKERKREVVTARTVAMYLIKNHTDKTLKEIGEVFGCRDHTTSIHSIKRVNDHIDTEQDFRRRVLIIENKLTT